MPAPAPDPPSLAALKARIITIRGHRVLIDADLAYLYGVTTKALNQAVKRNVARFPETRAFRLTVAEKAEVVTNCDHLSRLKFSPVLPLAFTEDGVPMAATVLSSDRAIKVSASVSEAFSRHRQLHSPNEQKSDFLITTNTNPGDPEKVVRWRQRRELALLLRHCRGLLRAQSPGETTRFYRRSYMWAVRQIAGKAINDCCMLDLCAREKGLPSNYLDELQLCTDGALKLIHPMAYMKARRIHEIMQESIKNGEDPAQVFAAELAINSAKTLILDGWSEAEVIQLHEHDITEMANKGNSNFLRRFLGIIDYHSEDPQRDTTQWILRAWLPLNFGGCPPDGAEAFLRFKAASELLGIPLPTHRDSWITSWRGVRSKNLSPKHSKSVSL